MNKVNNKSSPIPNSIKNITNSSKLTNLSFPNMPSVRKNGNKILKPQNNFKTRNNFRNKSNVKTRNTRSNPILKQTYKTLSIFCLLASLVLLGVLIYINFYYLREYAKGRGHILNTNEYYPNMKGIDNPPDMFQTKKARDRVTLVKQRLEASLNNKTNFTPNYNLDCQLEKDSFGGSSTQCSSTIYYLIRDRTKPGEYYIKSKDEGETVKFDMSRIKEDRPRMKFNPNYKYKDYNNPNTTELSSNWNNFLITHAKEGLSDDLKGTADTQDKNEIGKYIDIYVKSETKTNKLRPNEVIYENHVKILKTNMIKKNLIVGGLLVFFLFILFFTIIGYQKN